MKLHWRTIQRRGLQISVGYLPSDPDTTLFFISHLDGLMTGAFIPDSEEDHEYETVSQAKEVAEHFMRNWVKKHADEILED